MGIRLSNFKVEVQDINDGVVYSVDDTVETLEDVREQAIELIKTIESHFGYDLKIRY